MKKTYLIKYVFLLFFVLSAATVFAQSSVISGKVVDEANQPLPGATVTVKGTQKSAGTDANGNFRLTGVSDGTVTLQITFVGYQTIQKTVNVSGNVTVDFNLAPDSKSLNEVVVVGYGTERKKDLTGSIATVTSKDFDKGPITTPEQLIQGKVAGVSITSNSGAPGSGSTIRIRGGASVNGSNDPLIVVDGVPLSNEGISGAANPLALINPNDIESFSILKDASAAAIYGNRASNGVLLITTKKGKAGKLVINFNTQFSASNLPKEAPVMSPAEFYAYVIGHDTSSTGKYKNLLGTHPTDWEKVIYQTSYSTDNNLSISGSAVHDKLPYRVSVGYTDQNGILKTTSLQRYTASVNLSPSLFTDHLKINFNFKGSQIKQRFADEGGVISSAIYFNPTQPAKTSDPTYAPYGGYFQYADSTSANGLKALAPGNPLALLEQNNNRSTVQRAITSLALDYKLHFFPDLHANVNIAYDASKGSGFDDVPTNAASYYGRSQGGNYYYGNHSTYKTTIGNKLFEGFLSYNKDFKDIKSHVDAVAGYSLQRFHNNSIEGAYFADGYYYQGIFSDGTVNLGSGKDQYNNYPFQINEYDLASLYARVNYNYDEKYYLTGSIRNDNSTKFDPKTRTGIFPAGALAWKISNEDFLRNNKVISNLKLRVGYGVTGNQDGIGDYDYLAQYGLSNGTAQYQIGDQFYSMYRPGGYYPGRTWETTATSNVGIDFGFLNERITGSIDAYYRKTNHLLASITQPALTNFTNLITGNVGDMEDRGIEVNLTGRIIDKQDISWVANLNVTFNKNKITNLTVIPTADYPGLPVGGISGGTGNTVQLHQVGYSRNTFYVYQQVYDNNGKPLDGVFVDRNGDGIINNKDLYLDHHPDADEYFGFSSDFNYKKWNIGFVARASLGNYLYNNFQSVSGTERNILNPINILANGSRDVLNTDFSGNGSQAILSDYYVQNASFLKMDNAHIGYNVGQIFKGKATLSINANVQNVFTITQYKGVDPEISSGIDYNLYPRPRTYTLGLNLSLK